MIVIAGLALALVLLALVSRGNEASSEQMVLHLARQKDPRVLEAAASVLEGRGMRLTADALKARARALIPGPGKTDGASIAGEPAAPLESPLPEASDEAWTAFVRAMAGPSVIARVGARLGLFAIHLRRLEELSVVEDVRRAEGGEVTARWRRPSRERDFLANPALQYRVFVASMRGLRIVLGRGYEPYEVVVDGEPASLSGMLAVAHRLGVPGLDAWLMSPAERVRQRSASALFRRTNGIF